MLWMHMTNQVGCVAVSNEQEERCKNNKSRVQECWQMYLIEFVRGLCSRESMTQPTWLSTGGLWEWRVFFLRGVRWSTLALSFTTGKKRAALRDLGVFGVGGTISSCGSMAPWLEIYISILKYRIFKGSIQKFCETPRQDDDLLRKIYCILKVLKLNK